MSRRVFVPTICVMLSWFGAISIASNVSAAPSGLDALRQTPNYQQAVFRGAQNTTAWVNSPCRDAKAFLGTMIGSLKPPIFDKEGHALSGSWIEHITVKGCGRDRILNVVVFVRDQGQIGVTPMLPGTSRADPTLQKDAAPYAFTAAKLGANPCKPTYIADTLFVDYSNDASLVPGKRGWLERWTIATCDKRTMVEIRFTPDATGTVISARLQPSGDAR